MLRSYVHGCLRDLPLPYSYVLCCLRDLSMPYSYVLGCLRDLPMPYSYVLCCFRDLAMPYSYVLGCLSDFLMPYSHELVTCYRPTRVYLTLFVTGCYYYRCVSALLEPARANGAVQRPFVTATVRQPASLQYLVHVILILRLFKEELR